ncbi:MBL fold hydrolase [Candidatus Aerophobetes bacterium]|uniref:MBL fold hydrolase n=1 Tax=Aerophobetes bacterium TaxID=2030807 RepID=A0A662DBT1_UNCAE|nr:MAG: MBL fold hydrolase [Candidatus Aerophobetes bacterium]
MKITVVYDNVSHGNFKSGWGFSCYIEGKRKILFDVGWSPSVILHNLKCAGIDIYSIDAIVLSHQHWDHIGALPAILELNDDFKVYVPSSFSKRLKDEIKKRAELFEIKNYERVFKDVFTTGEIGKSLKEQSLIIKSKKGNFLITGCAHPGVDNIIELTRRFGEIYGIMGGFHDFAKINMLEELFTVPCHCTQYKEEILKLCKRSARCYAGLSIDI